MQNLVIISVFAQGHYSGNTEEQSMVLPEHIFKHIEQGISKSKLVISDLDGKHSHVTATISTKLVMFEDLNNYNWSNENSYLDNLYELVEALLPSSIDLDKELSDLNLFLDSLDTKVTIRFDVLKSNELKVLELVKDFIVE